MKHFAFILGAVTLLAGGIAFARLITYDETKPPRLSLPDAYQLATRALGSETNQFRCLGAGIVISRSPDGEWLFTFCTTNQPPARKYVFVFFDKQTQVTDHLSF
jgi:hypothetical protein